MIFAVTGINVKKSADRLWVKRLKFLLLLPGLLLVVLAAGFEQESRVKAAFVYRFCDYVHWPDSAFVSAESPLVIGVSGEPSQIAEVRAAVKHKKMGQRTFQVREVVGQHDLQGLHVFYLTRDATEPLGSFIKTEDLHPVLVITDAERASPLSIINFLLIDSRIRFEISQVRAEQVSLKLSAELLSIAHRIEGKQHQ